MESADDLVTTSSLFEGMEPVETTTTAAPTTTDEPTTSTTSLSPTPGSNWVPTPQLGAPGETTTTTAVPLAPSDPVIESDTSVTSDAETQEPAADVDTEVLGESAHRVVAGENLWTISRDAIAASTGRDASDVSESEVRSYWLQVIDANRDNLRSGDPHWIFAGESINLPALDAAQ